VQTLLPILKEIPGIRKGKEYDDGAPALFIKQEDAPQALGHFPSDFDYKRIGLAKSANPIEFFWRPQGDLNPCCPAKRGMSLA
jgi:hypothetical protein